MGPRHPSPTLTQTSLASYQTQTTPTFQARTQRITIFKNMPETGFLTKQDCPESGMVDGHVDQWGQYILFSVVFDPPLSVTSAAVFGSYRYLSSLYS